MSPNLQSPPGSLLLLAIALVGALAGGATVVSADGPAVQVSSVTVTPDDPIEGETVTFETTISNLEGSSGTVRISDIYLRRTGSTREYARIGNVGSVAPGGSLTVPIRAAFQNAGEKSLTVRVVVTDQNGSVSAYTYPASVDVEAPVVRGGLSTENRSDGTSVTLSNYGNVNFTDVAISSSVGGSVRDRQLTGDVEPDANRTVTFDTADYGSDNVTFRASYTANGAAREVSRTVDIDRQVTGEIRLTSVEVRRSGGTVSLEGDAANVGGTDAESVLVRVRNTGDVSPAGGSGEYFIGPVDASEFATFELSAAVDSGAGASSVPVEISYIVDDERVTTTQRLDLDSTASSGGDTASGADGQGDSGGSDGGQSGLPLVGIGVALALLVVAGVAVIRWRNR